MAYPYMRPSQEIALDRSNPSEKCYDRDVRGEVTSLLSQHPSEYTTKVQERVRGR
jgi:hypothetical protein